MNMNRMRSSLVAMICLLAVSVLAPDALAQRVPAGQDFYGTYSVRVTVQTPGTHCQAGQVFGQLWLVSQRRAGEIQIDVAGIGDPEGVYVASLSGGQLMLHGRTISDLTGILSRGRRPGTVTGTLTRGSSVWKVEGRLLPSS